MYLDHKKYEFDCEEEEMNFQTLNHQVKFIYCQFVCCFFNTQDHKER